MAFVTPRGRPELDAAECDHCHFLVTGAEIASRNLDACPKCGVPADKHKEIEHVLMAEPITAWRVWKVVKRDQVTLDSTVINRMSETWAAGGNPFAGLLGHRLSAVAANHYWDADETASCGRSNGQMNMALSGSPIIASPARPGHESPARDCGCGIWAVKTEETLWAALRNYTNGTTMAYGKVQMWGRFYEHKLGYRAQYARPVEVTVVDGKDEVCRELADFYGCEVKSGPLPEKAGLVKLEADHLSSLSTSMFQQYYSQMMMLSPRRSVLGSWSFQSRSSGGLQSAPPVTKNALEQSRLALEHLRKEQKRRKKRRP